MEKENPDAILIYGDTNSCLAAICAKKRKIPIFHMEAGNRCFDQRVPEEINRKIVDHLSDINMPLTEHGRTYLIREGVPHNTIVKTGSCMQEILNYYSEEINQSKILQKLDLSPKKYFVVSAHREENVDNAKVLKSLAMALNELVNEYDMPVIFSVHPRTKKRIDDLESFNLDKRIRLMKPLGFHDYVFLQKNSKCVISDSGTLMEESAILGFNAVLARETHERPEGTDKGQLVLSPMEPKTLLRAVNYVSQRQLKDYKNPIDDYRVEQVSKTVVSTILSYIQFVNRTVWYKEMA